MPVVEAAQVRARRRAARSSRQSSCGCRPGGAAGVARYLADHIAGAVLVELPGEDNLSIVGDTDAVIGEVQEFLTGTRTVPELDRVLAMVLFTDVVASTDRVAEIGDHEWRKLLDRHDELVTHSSNGSAVASSRPRVTVYSLLSTVLPIAIRGAEAIAHRAHALGLQVRSGVHTGEVELRGDDVSGIAVHVAQRVCSTADGGQILVSRTVVDLTAGSELRLEARGHYQLKGLPGHLAAFRHQELTPKSLGHIRALETPLG